MNTLQSTRWAARVVMAIAMALALMVVPTRGADQPVSFFKDVVPILKKSCVGCHHPGKAKGKLDLTTFAAFKAGGKHGVAFVAGDAAKSRVIKMISGPEPDMPDEGDPLSAEQVALIARWIKQGAVDDSPPPVGPAIPAQPPIYLAAPPVVDLAYAPDGSVLAVTGYHEVLLHKPDGSGLIARLIGGSPRVTAITFSKDAKLLAVVGGSPAQWGEVQVWDVAAKKLYQSHRVGNDTLFGVSFSSDAKRIAFGCADKTARIIDADTGEQQLEFEAHTDWVFGTTWTVDGKRLLTGSRDKAMKLVDLATKRFIDDINNPLEPIYKIVRHPTQDLVAYGGKAGAVRVYKISDNQKRTAGRNDTNLVRNFERQPGPVLAIDYSADGKMLAVGSLASDARVYNADNGQRIATLAGHEGAVYSICFHPNGKQVATGGYDGFVRIFEVPSGKLLKKFVPVPLSGEPDKAAAK